MRRDKIERRRTFVDLLKELVPLGSMTLEIGVAAGDFSDCLMRELRPKHHTMVDLWVDEGDDLRSQWFTKGGPAEEALAFVRERFEGKPVEIVRTWSYAFLLRAIREQVQFGLIYVDGDHHSEAVYLDLMLSWQLVQPGGVLAGDDLNWKSQSTGIHEVRKGVRKFEATIGKTVVRVDGDDWGLRQYYIVKE